MMRPEARSMRVYDYEHIRTPRGNRRRRAIHRHGLFTLLAAVTIACAGVAVTAQTAPASQAAPAPGDTPAPTSEARVVSPEWRNQMPQIAAALGVTCEFCHAPATDTSPGGAPKRALARQMIFLVDDINGRIPDITGKAGAAAARVSCVTCHRGVTIPRQLSEIVLLTTVQQGAGSAVAQYRDLRARYHGRGGYDFGEDELIITGTRLSNSRPDDAVAVLELNLEFHPNSVRTYLALAQAHTRRLDDATAITMLEKALEIEPTNGIVQGRLTQLKRIQRR
jgi:Photosynthetic reaction centre cytochrome C subunit